MITAAAWDKPHNAPKQGRQQRGTRHGEKGSGENAQILCCRSPGCRICGIQAHCLLRKQHAAQSKDTGKYKGKEQIQVIAPLYLSPVYVVDHDGSEYQVACFAMICHHCGQRYVEFFPNARQENLFVGMIHGFAYMGIPKYILTDNWAKKKATLNFIVQGSLS